MNPDKLVVLVHGFCSRAEDMDFWRKSLNRDFENIAVADMPARYKSFECCLEVLFNTVRAAEPEKYKSLYIAGHSMGGLLAREFLQREKPANAERLVVVGTPHYGTRLADLLLKIPGCGRIWQPLRALSTGARKTLTSPDIPGLKIGAIVGRNNAHWPGKFFLPDRADGLVECFSAHAPDADDVVYVDVPHDPMQYDLKIADLIRNFFLNGSFNQ